MPSGMVALTRIAYRRRPRWKATVAWAVTPSPVAVTVPVKAPSPVAASGAAVTVTSAVPWAGMVRVSAPRVRTPLWTCPRSSLRIALRLAVVSW